jgi:hypothetical protein
MTPPSTLALRAPRWLVLAGILAHTSASFAQADNCESIRAQIESKIAASGVARFTVTVVDAQAATDGQVVGSCGLGTRKIIYSRQDDSGGASTAPNATPPATPGMLTECRDGSAPVNGNCPK